MAAEALADAHARQGRAADDVALLEELAARDPLRESVAVQLVRALYAAGRQADALAAYDRCCGALADELGVEPTPALRQVRAAVLAHDPLPGVGGTVLPTHLPPAEPLVRGPPRAARGRRRDAGRRHPPPARRRAHRAGRGGQDRARAGAGPPAAPARPGRLVDLRRRPRRHRHRARRAGRRAGDRPVRAARGRPRGAVGRAGPHAGLAARLRQRGRARAARAVPARGPARRRHHHLAQPGLAAHRPPRRGRAAGPRRVAGLRRHPHRRPARRGGHARRAARRPAAGARAGVRLHRADADVAARLRDLFRRHRDGLLLRDVEGSGRTVATTWGLAFDRLAARAPRAAELLETIAFLAPDAISVAHAGPVRAGRAGAAGGAARAAAAVAGRPRGRHGAGAPAGAGRRARPDERGGAPRPAGRVAQACVAQATESTEAGRDVPDDLAAHLVALAVHAEALGVRAGRAGRGPRAGGRPAGASGRSTRPPSTCCARRCGCTARSRSTPRSVAA